MTSTKKKLDGIEIMVGRMNQRLATVEVQSAGNRGILQRLEREIETVPPTPQFDVAKVRIVQFDGLSERTYSASPRRMSYGGPLRVRVGDIVSLEERFGRKPVGVVQEIVKRPHEASWLITAVGGRVANSNERHF